MGQNSSQWNLTSSQRNTREVKPQAAASQWRGRASRT